MLSKKLKRESYRQDVHRLVRDERISVGARYLWLLLETFTRQDSWQCFPAIEKLCDISGKSKPWIITHLAELQQAGFLVKSKRITQKKAVGNLYELRFPDAGKSVQVG